MLLKNKKFTKAIKYIVFLAVIGAGVFVYNNQLAKEDQGQEINSLCQKDQVTDSLVRLLGLVGIRIQNDILTPEPDWPEARLTVSSRSLEEITQVIQGKKDPGITWIIQGERWQTKGLGYLTLTSEQAAAVLNFISKDLGLGQAMRPKQKEYAGVLFLGSTLKNVRDRLKFLNACLEQHNFVFNRIYILTGIRPLDPTVGETPESLVDPKGIIAVRSDWKQPAGALPNDEGPMIQWVFDQSRSNAIGKDQVTVIYAGIGEGRKRATTKTTVEEWLKTNPKDGLYLAVSSQPFNFYQKLVIERTLLENKRPGIHIEVIGDAAGEQSYGLNKANPDDLNKYAAIALDNIARTCYELVSIQGY